MAVTANETANEILFADFPTELVGFEHMDKFMLRRWIIGNAVLQGWEYRRFTNLGGELIKRGTAVGVSVRPEGVELRHCHQAELLKTKS